MQQSIPVAPECACSCSFLIELLARWCPRLSAAADLRSCRLSLPAGLGQEDGGRQNVASSDDLAFGPDSQETSTPHTAKQIREQPSRQPLLNAGSAERGQAGGELQHEARDVPRGERSNGALLTLCQSDWV